MLKLQLAGLTVAILAACAPALAHAQSGPVAEARPKNWIAPSRKIMAQALAEAIMKAHPELLSVTFHGTPPDAASGVYTMFAGSYPDRIGNPDDPDDIDVITKGITIVDPRWRRSHDAVAKFVVQEPLRDQSNANIGLIVYAFRLSSTPGLTERDYFDRAVVMRDDLAKHITTFQALFAPAP